MSYNGRVSKVLGKQSDITIHPVDGDDHNKGATEHEVVEIVYYDPDPPERQEGDDPDFVPEPLDD